MDTTTLTKLALKERFEADLEDRINAYGRSLVLQNYLQFCELGFDQIEIGIAVNIKNNTDDKASSRQTNADDSRNA